MNQLNTSTLPSHAFKPSPFLGASPSPAGADSELLRKTFAANVISSASSPGRFVRQTIMQQTPTASLQAQLYNSLAACKIKTATIAMHLSSEWRSRFFAQLDSLLDAESWDKQDIPTTDASFTTLIRMILFVRPARRPGLGATSDGNFIAAWTVGKDRLTIECQPDDRVRWVISHEIDGQRETAAGDTPLPRLLDVLAPYNPQRWFMNAPDQAAP